MQDNPGISKMLEEFELGLRKYRHFIKRLDLDVESIKRVEEVQLKIGELLKDSRILDGREGLREVIGKLLDSGILARLVEEASMELNLTSPGDLEEALKRVLAGDLDYPGAHATLIVLQGIARFYADSVLEREGLGHEPSAKCPLCGAMSETMVKKGDAYTMVCHFCAYQWVVSRRSLMCPYCGSTHPISIGIYSDKKKRIALARCQDCGATWRLILDESIRPPRVLLPLIALGAEAYRPFLHAHSSEG
ncbi:MAG: formate dehydrogenase accessory protein FdhE [Desulfurococcales archaeon]|nr:formate dehydrogenase accessory protein FdhE [Desulfurococcales archaeon]